MKILPEYEFYCATPGMLVEFRSGTERVAVLVTWSPDGSRPPRDVIEGRARYLAEKELIRAGKLPGGEART